MRLKLKCIDNIDHYGEFLKLTIGKYYIVGKILSLDGRILVDNEDINKEDEYQFLLINDEDDIIWYNYKRFDMSEYFRDQTINNILK